MSDMIKMALHGTFHIENSYRNFFLSWYNMEFKVVFKFYVTSSSSELCVFCVQNLEAGILIFSLNVIHFFCFRYEKYRLVVVVVVVERLAVSGEHNVWAISHFLCSFFFFTNPPFCCRFSCLTLHY